MSESLADAALLTATVQRCVWSGVLNASRSFWVRTVALLPYIIGLWIVTPFVNITHSSVRNTVGVNQKSRTYSNADAVVRGHEVGRQGACRQSRVACHHFRLRRQTPRSPSSSSYSSGLQLNNILQTFLTTTWLTHLSTVGITILAIDLFVTFLSSFWVMNFRTKPRSRKAETCAG